MSYFALIHFMQIPSKSENTSAEVRYHFYIWYRITPLIAFTCHSSQNLLNNHHSYESFHGQKLVPSRSCEFNWKSDHILNHLLYTLNAFPNTFEIHGVFFSLVTINFEKLRQFLSVFHSEKSYRKPIKWATTNFICINK